MAFYLGGKEGHQRMEMADDSKDGKMKGRGRYNPEGGKDFATRGEVMSRKGQCMEIKELIGPEKKVSARCATGEVRRAEESALH